LHLPSIHLQDSKPISNLADQYEDFTHTQQKQK